MKTYRTLLLLMLSLMVTSTAWAEFINESQARAIASRFMAERAMPSTGLKMTHKASRLGTAPGEKAAYYVFNGNTGYVIVAGDDRAPAILGYSERGSFDAQQVPEALQHLLDGYAAQIEDLARGAKSAPVYRAGSAISPLVTAEWSQNAPYNTLLPMMSNGERAVVGCVGTALAQVMYYWQWPVRPSKAIPAYTSTTYLINMPELPVIGFDWDVMQDSYLTNDLTSDGAVAAATLSLYCDQALQMDFLLGVSSGRSFRIPELISTYFGYKSSAHIESRENYSTEGWNDLLYAELAAGRPVIYSGDKRTGGHAFICDGYDGNGMFHINWGWNGLSNGYFLLNVMNPDEQGTGSISGSYGYILNQAAIIGIEPGEESETLFAFTANNVTLDGMTTSRIGSNFPFTVTVSGRFNNYTSQEMSASFGWGFYQGDNLVSVLYNSYINNLPPHYYTSTVNKELEFGKNITEGTYRIVPIYSELFADNWCPCIGADHNYIEVTIDGDNCTVTGYGSAGISDYIVNDVTTTGSMCNGRPVDIFVNMTNNGQTDNRLMYMFVNGTFSAAGYVGLAPGETGDIPFQFTPSSAGTYTVTWSWNENGSEPFLTHDFVINQMPAASLSSTIRVLNVTDDYNYIITSDKFAVVFTITNQGATPYNQDITVKLYKNLDNQYASNAQTQNVPISLLPGETDTVSVEFENVIDGWDYFVYATYYTEGRQALLARTGFYTIQFPEVPQALPGDADGDGKVTIRDITALIDYLLGDSADGINVANADADNDGKVNIKDVTAIIDILLN